MVSIDIDLVTNSSIKNDLMCYLIEKQQYGRDKSEGQSTAVKYVKSGEDIKIIRLDFISRSRKYPFEGTDKSLDFDALDRNTRFNVIGDGVYFGYLAGQNY